MTWKLKDNYPSLFSSPSGWPESSQMIILPFSHPHQDDLEAQRWLSFPFLIPIRMTWKLKDDYPSLFSSPSGWPGSSKTIILPFYHPHQNDMKAQRWLSVPFLIPIRMTWKLKDDYHPLFSSPSRWPGSTDPIESTEPPVGLQKSSINQSSLLLEILFKEDDLVASHQSSLTNKLKDQRRWPGNS